MDSGTMLWLGLILILLEVDSSSPHVMHKHAPEYLSYQRNFIGLTTTSVQENAGSYVHTPL